MRNPEVARQMQRFSSLYSDAKDASADNMQLQAHWARYLCILLSGLVENGIKELYSDYIKVSAQKPVADYAIAYLQTIQNPKAEKILTTVGAFKKEWRQQLEDFVSEKGRKDAIDSVMSNRNNIAHGKDVGITLVRLHDFYKKIIEVLEYIENQCNPLPRRP